MKINLNIRWILVCIIASWVLALFFGNAAFAKQVLNELITSGSLRSTSGDNAGFFTVGQSSPVATVTATGKKLYSGYILYKDYISPEVTTLAVGGQSTTTATGNGNITNLGYPAPTDHGVCWSTSANPTISSSKVSKGSASATGKFTANITGLSAGTTYHIRAFITNSVGTVYGTDLTFQTQAGQSTGGNDTPTPPTPPTSTSDPDSNSDPGADPEPDSGIFTVAMQAINQAEGDKQGGQGGQPEEIVKVVLPIVVEGFNNAGNAVKEGKDVDGKEVIDILKSTVTFASDALNTQLDDAGLSIIVESSTDILKSLPAIIASLDREEGLGIVAEVDDIISVGLSAGLSALGAEPAELEPFIGSISDVVSALAVDTTISGNTYAVTLASDILTESLNVISKISEQEGYNSDVSRLTGQLQTEAASIINHIKSNILQNQIPFTDFVGSKTRKLNLAKDGTSTTTDTTNDESIKIAQEKMRDLIAEVGNIIRPFLMKNIPLSKALTESIKSLLDAAAEAIIDDLAAAKGVKIGKDSLVQDSLAMAEVLSKNSDFLKDILEVTGVDIICEVENSRLIDKILASDENISAQDADLIAAAFPIVPELEHDLFEECRVCAKDILKTALAKALEGMTISVNSSFPGIMTVKASFDGTAFDYPVQIIGIDLLSSIVPDGIYGLKDGCIISVVNPVAVTIVPTINNIYNFITSLAGDYGLSFKLLNDGRWITKSKETAVSIIGVTGYGIEKLPEDDRLETVSSETLTIDFGERETDHASIDYTLEVIFDGNYVQVIPPALYSLDLLTSWLDSMEIGFAMNRNNGVLTIAETLYFKPDYLLYDLDEETLKYWELNKDSYGIAWKVEDFNKDGLEDLEMYTEYGKQIIYQLP